MSSLTEKLKAKEEEKDKGFSTIFWRPEEGEILEGIASAIAETITSEGDAEIIDITTDGGKTYTVFINSVLRKSLEVEEVQAGDRIAIKFLGLKESHKNKKHKYKDYLVVKEDPEEK